MKPNRLNTEYVVISPVRDEAEFLPRVIRSMEAQTIQPKEWIVVDDGSTDGTTEILLAAAARLPWMNVVQKPDRGERSVGPGVVEAFYYGFERMRSQSYDYIVKMDGDIEFNADYVETLLSYFERDPHLGSASGKIFLPVGDKLVEERTSDEMTIGAFNFYRRQAFEDIGGFVREVMWDGIAYHRARIAGWRTRSIADPRLNFIHKRLMGSSHKSILHGRVRWGRGQYFMGTHPLYIIAITAYRMLEKPFIIGGLGILAGYLTSALKRMKRYGDDAFRHSLHAWQMERLKIGERLENIPGPDTNYAQPHNL